MRGGVQDAYRTQHPAREPDRRAHGEQHGGGLAGGYVQPAFEDPRTHLPGGRIGHDDGDDVPVAYDRRRDDQAAVPLPGPDLLGIIAASPQEGLLEGQAPLPRPGHRPALRGPCHGLSVAVEDPARMPYTSK